MMLQRNLNLLALTPRQLSSHHTEAFQPSRNLHCQSCSFCKGKAKKTATNRYKQIAFAAMHKLRTAQPMKLQAKCSSPAQSAVGKFPLRRQSQIHLKTWKKVSKVDSSPCTSNCSNTCSAAAKAQHDFQWGKQRHRNITQQTCTVILHSNPKQ